MFRRFTQLLVLLVLTGCSQLPPGDFVPYYQVETQKPYDDVLAELKSAIAEHNFRITAHSRVGKVIRERGDQNFPDFDTLQFCNLTHARTMLLISPSAIKFMPCNVVMYMQNGKTIVRTHLLPAGHENPALHDFFEKMNQELREIVDFAVQE